MDEAWWRIAATSDAAWRRHHTACFKSEAAFSAIVQGSILNYTASSATMPRRPKLSSN
jgi:hypothetical protein